MLSVAFAARSPKRTHAEPCKYQAEPRRSSHSPVRSLARMVGGVLAEQGHPTNARKHQKNKASYFQPELMQHRTEMSQGRPGAAQQSYISSATFYLLAGNSGRDANFLRRRGIPHCSRFYQPSGLEYGLEG